MYVVDYVGEIYRFYGAKLKNCQELGMFTTPIYILAVRYSEAVKIRNKRY